MSWLCEIHHIDGQSDRCWLIIWLGLMCKVMYIGRHALVNKDFMEVAFVRSFEFFLKLYVVK